MNEELIKKKKEKEELTRKKDSQCEENLKRKEYFDERKSLINAMFEESKLFDTHILTLASGALGLSLAFIRQIAPNPKALFILIIGWLCFCISICLTLCSILTSQDACKKQIEIIEEDLDDSNEYKKNTNENKLTICVRRLNILSIIFFITGVISIICFTIYNLYY